MENMELLMFINGKSTPIKASANSEAYSLQAQMIEDAAEAISERYHNVAKMNASDAEFDSLLESIARTIRASEKLCVAQIDEAIRLGVKYVCTNKSLKRINQICWTLDKTRQNKRANEIRQYIAQYIGLDNTSVKFVKETRTLIFDNVPKKVITELCTARQEYWNTTPFSLFLEQDAEEIHKPEKTEYDKASQALCLLYEAGYTVHARSLKEEFEQSWPEQILEKYRYKWQR